MRKKLQKVNNRYAVIFFSYILLISLILYAGHLHIFATTHEGGSGNNAITELLKLLTGDDYEVDYTHPDQPNTQGITETPIVNITVPPGSTHGSCPEDSAVQMAGTRYKHLNRYLPCDNPRMIVIHWSAGWSSAQATFDTLNNRDRSCQFAVDENETMQMLNMYSGPIERGWCAGGDNNVGSINFEITGAWFDEVLDQPATRKYEDLMTMTDKTVALSCQFIQMYGISKNAIYGHYQLQSGKSDPGPKYLQFFKDKVNQSC